MRKGRTVRGRGKQLERGAAKAQPERNRSQSSGRLRAEVVQHERGERPGAGSLHNRSDLFEVEVLDGLAPICKVELTELLGAEGQVLKSKRPDQLTFEFKGRSSALLRLRTAVAVFQLLYFKVPNPRSVVQGPNLERLLAAIDRIKQHGRFSSFRIGAAGSDSPTFQKIKNLIERNTGLTFDRDGGEMVIRFRRSQLKPFGWDVLIRITPRPLSARQWRVENMPGALNATVAAAMVLATKPRQSDRFLNIMCGSGTILAERAAICPAAQMLGVDIASSALKKAERNLSRLRSKPLLLCEDIQRLSLKDRSFNVVCADLPWGRLVGDRAKLQGLYAETIRQAGRVCEAGGTFAVLTQENGLFEGALGDFKADWELLSSARVKQADYKPTLYLLRRKG
jgi:tRNA (guanine6-N2)-methyltransferase